MPESTAPDRPRFVFHIAFERDWQAVDQDGTYAVSTRGARLDDVGFIHAAFDHQVERVGAGLYGDASEPLTVLVIDTQRLEVPVVIENLEGGDESFPHIYGPLPRRAVVHVRRATIAADGRFVVEPGQHA